MNPRIPLVAFCLAHSLPACAPLPTLGGGVAGAGMDTSWVREGAENYRGFTGQNVSVVHSLDQRSAMQHDRRELLHRFEQRAFVSDDGPVEFGGLTITFRHQRITIARRNDVIVTESIPSAFYFSGLQVAATHIHGEPCLLLLTFSRASTGMVWVGFYRADGTRLYLATVSRGDIWDVVPTADGLTLLGHSGSTTVTVKPQ